MVVILEDFMFIKIKLSINMLTELLFYFLDQYEAFILTKS